MNKEEKIEKALSFWEKLISSLDTHSKGFSGRKLTAVIFCIFAGYIHVRYVDETIAISALMIDCGVILMCLSIVTAEQVLKFKDNNANSIPNTEPK